MTLVLHTLGPGFRKVCFRAPDLPYPCGRSAQTHKTYAVSPKNQLHVDGAIVNIKLNHLCMRKGLEFCGAFFAPFLVVPHFQGLNKP